MKTNQKFCVLENNFESLEQEVDVKNPVEADKNNSEYKIRSFEKTRTDNYSLEKEYEKVGDPIAYGVYENYEDYVNGVNESNQEYGENAIIVSEPEYNSGIRNLKDLRAKLTQIRVAVFNKANFKIPFDSANNDIFWCVSDEKGNNKGFKINIMGVMSLKDSYMIKPDFKIYKARTVYDLPVDNN